MAMMMAGRVLLVCALCVLWCGAGGGCEEGEVAVVAGSPGNVSVVTPNSQLELPLLEGQASNIQSPKVGKELPTVAGVSSEITEKNNAGGGGGENEELQERQRQGQAGGIRHDGQDGAHKEEDRQEEQEETKKKRVKDQNSHESDPVKLAELPLNQIKDSPSHSSNDVEKSDKKISGIATPLGNGDQLQDALRPLPNASTTLSTEENTSFYSTGSGGDDNSHEKNNDANNAPQSSSTGIEQQDTEPHGKSITFTDSGEASKLPVTTVTKTSDTVAAGGTPSAAMALQHNTGMEDIPATPDSSQPSTGGAEQPSATPDREEASDSTENGISQSAGSATEAMTTAKTNDTTTPVDSDSSTAVSHTTSSLLLLLHAAAAAVVAA
ncbi:Mucin-associated surface protein (MASP) [Trypanosoma cruzi]|uniref:Mucin-associated surface protein (MASP), putative n=2 Tax=Trypanosoma cruzi TaxID=5693 RepID=Q4CQU7_TRYCC|nr:mucin-associated surface protein (MASP), putative [Trypanosoma cruzi]XP_804610.1 mucin-associated surface protein (MASP), putative [Trypanosoma cruzi]EAN82649.1 mucin-associated surface protein (MASP), putative [Trypanosoma cruzi]EAN82759.1 mucin-associated surface protein (MASP), putative [Trypanosoma cruzi]PWU93370.1 Mucin-associated surface protein (MASP) [Trypanosoma cruzi]PWV03934.1 Mucin-associated surface protein (MASP) [Trypanosoma cruzi]RNC35050.1 mucin-associated surface protein |eukprot:XP_804500.1 mucin-associated surface protein (MASP) [Trypanosoma cruzi strain CL Brener]